MLLLQQYTAAYVAQTTNLRETNAMGKLILSLISNHAKPLYCFKKSIS